jgi:hypothetical protein
MEHTGKESSTGHDQDEDGRCSKQDDEVILIYLKWKYEITSFEFIEQFMLTHITRAPYVHDVLFILKTDCLQQAHLEEYKTLIDLKATLRQSNLNPERPGIILFSFE